MNDTVKIVRCNGDPTTPRPQKGEGGWYGDTVIWLDTGGIRPIELGEHDIYEGLPEHPAGYINGIEWRSGQPPEYNARYVRAEVADALKEENQRLRAQIAAIKAAVSLWDS